MKFYKKETLFEEKQGYEGSRNKKSKDGKENAFKEIIT